MKIKYIYLAETFFESVLADCFTFGSLVFSFWFNHTYIDDNKLLYAIILIIWLLAIAGRSRTKVFTSKKQIIEWLQKDDDK